MKATHEDMVKWAEASDKLELFDISDFVEKVMLEYEMDEMSKLNLFNAASAAFINKIIEKLGLEDESIEKAKEILVRAMYPQLGSGIYTIILWSKLLDPTGNDYFKKIPRRLFEVIQADAKILMAGEYSDELKNHWQSIIDGNVPFGFELV